MLPTLLAAIRRPDDVTPLFQALGFDPADGDYDERGRWVAAWRGLRVAAVAASDPTAAARLVARRLTDAGERAVAVAVSADMLAIAATRVGMPHPTRALAVPLRGATPDVLAQLERLRPRGVPNALALLLRIADVLSAEAVGERFFAAFRSTLERMVASLGDRGTDHDRRTAALLALSRVLFLNFVQAKGWLAGDPHFLRTAFDRALARHRHFHRAVLTPLFFRTLNRSPVDRSRAHVARGIPYLNGGLFEPHPVERRIGPVHFDNALWRDAFDGLFERYRFSVREADEANAVAPDMLGRVFERLMHPDERHASGAYYTPEVLVRQIVERTLAVAMAARGIEEEVVERIHRAEPIAPQHRRAARDALRHIRVLDPAAGSGAFLLGGLDVLTEWNLAVRTRRDAVARWRLRHRILRENLFGVDLNPMAVRLAELRLWLAVVCDDPTTEPQDVAPLPNLDGIVLQGDALLDPIAAARQCAPHLAPPSSLVAAVEGARAALFDARGAARDPAIRAVRRAESRLAGAVIHRALHAADHALEDLAAHEGSADLFGAPGGLTPIQRRTRDALEHDRRSLRDARARLDDHGIPFFSFEVHLPAAAGYGFDAVVGNPPWVRAECLAPAYRTDLARRFRTWRSGGRRGFRHQPDLSVAFLERALELTAPGGAVGFLLPSKLTTAGYGAPARRHLVRETTIHYLHRVPETEASAFGATTYPLGVVVRRAPPEPDHAVRLGFSSCDRLSQSSLSAGGPWVLLPNRHTEALAAARACGVPMGTVARPVLGVKTGADRVLVGEVLERRGAVAVVRFGDSEVLLECEVLRPVVRGRDVGCFAASARRVVLWGYDRSGRPRSRLPPHAAAYVRAHEGHLTARRDYRGSAPWSLFRLRGALATHRVVWPDIARRPSAAVLDATRAAEAVPLNTCYVASAPSSTAAMALVAVINSSWTAALAGAVADEARGGYRRFNASVMEAIPVPEALDRHAGLANLARRAHGGAHVDQDALDDAVADALRLPDSVRERLRALAPTGR